MRAALYARYSSDNQREASIDDQFRNCERVCSTYDWEIVARFKDEAISGARANRAGYQSLLDAAKQQTFDVIVTDEVSRLWRDQEEQWRAVKRLEFWGVHIVGVNDGVNTRNDGYSLLLSIRGAMNEEARREVAKRTHRGLTGQALKGHNCGSRSYGYRHIPIEDPTRLDSFGRPTVVAVRREIDPEEAKWVRRIFEWYADGQSPRWIANELNRLGVPSPGSKWRRKVRLCRGWDYTAIRPDVKRGFGILINPLYIGRFTWNRTKRLVDPDTKHRKHGKRPQAEWVTQEKPELRIIAQDLWERVQARIHEQREKSKNVQIALHQNARTGRGPKYLFSGLLKCGECGASYIMVNERQYGCSGHRGRGPEFCGNSIRGKRATVETQLIAAIKERLYTPKRMERMRELLSQGIASMSKARPDTEKLRADLAGVEQGIERIVEAIKAGAFSQALSAELQRLEAERERLLVAIRATPARGDRVASLLDEAMEAYREMVWRLEVVAERDPTRARAEVRRYVQQIPLRQEESHLVAELSENYSGVLKLLDVDKWCTEERT